MGAQWRFVQDEHAQWRWMRIGDKDEQIESAAAFPDAAQCMMDAVRFVIQRHQAEPGIDGADPTSQPH